MPIGLLCLNRQNALKPSESRKKPGKRKSLKVARAKKLSFKEIRELEQLPALIEQLENRQAELNSAINNPDFYKQSPEAVAAALADLKSTDDGLAQAYARWEALDGLQ